jgi:two-component system sensor histidine kinase YesM
MKKLTFGMKLTLIFVITFVILGALIGYYSYSDASNIVMKNKKSEMADTINRIDININVKVRSMTELAESTVSSHIIRDILESKDTGIEIANQQTYLEEYFYNLESSFDAISSIMIVNGSDIIYSSNGNISGQQSEIKLENYNKTARDNIGKVTWLGSVNSLFPQKGNDNHVISMVSAITDEDSSKILGVLIIELNPRTFSDLLLGNESNFLNQYTFIVDNKGAVICSNKNVDNSWFSEIDENFKKGIRKFELDWKGMKYYVCGQYNGVTGWKTYSVVSTKNIFPQSETLKKSILFFVAISTIGVSVIIIIISYTMTRPINMLSAAMKSVLKENFDIHIPNTRKDEIGKLIDSFNFMINKISTLIKEVYQEKLAQKNAELEALQAQINPHFLYNTLDSINWMLIDRDEYEISEIIISLGNLMKYSIDKQNSFVPLEQEFEYILSYLRIQKNRLEDRLDYNIELQESIKNYQVPKLILQPLVENAIKHGIEPCKKGGTVGIKAVETQEYISIIVEDNGNGMTEDKLNKLLSSSNGDESYTNIGVRNVDRRIRLHFGDEYKLRIESTLGIGTKITIAIPKNNGECA